MGSWVWARPTVAGRDEVVRAQVADAVPSSGAGNSGGSGNMAVRDDEEEKVEEQDEEDEEEEEEGPGVNSMPRKLAAPEGSPPRRFSLGPAVRRTAGGPYEVIKRGRVSVHTRQESSGWKDKTRGGGGTSMAVMARCRGSPRSVALVGVLGGAPFSSSSSSSDPDSSEEEPSSSAILVLRCSASLALATYYCGCSCLCVCTWDNQKKDKVSEGTTWRRAFHTSFACRTMACWPRASAPPFRNLTTLVA